MKTKTKREEIDFLKKRILKFAQLLQTEQDESFRESYMDAIEGFFQQIAQLELRIASEQSLLH
jgi:hypothetical protein